MESRRSGYQDGHQRAPIYQAPRPRPLPQSPNHGHHLNHRNNPNQALHSPAYDDPYGDPYEDSDDDSDANSDDHSYDESDDDSAYDDAYDGLYRPQPVDRGHRRDDHQHNRSSEALKASPRPQQPYHLQHDPRLPTDGSYPSDPIYLSSPDGFATHSLLLLSPSSDILSTTLAEAKNAREPTGHVPAEDIVERALENRTLQHISNGPSGGIWVVAPEKPEVVACLVAEMQGGWEILGVGKGGNEGMIFLRHPCGFGPEAEAEMKKKTKMGKRTERANVAKKVRFEERDREQERAWESEEDDGEDRVQFGGHTRVRFVDEEGGRPREGAYNVDRGQHMERGRAADRGHREREFDGDERIGRNQDAGHNRRGNRDWAPAAHIYRGFDERIRRRQRE